MQRFSVFQFHQFESLETIQTTLNGNREQCYSVRDWQEQDHLVSRVREVQNFSISEHKTLQIGNRNIQYIFFNGYTERARKCEYFNALDQLINRDDRVNSFNANILIFECNSMVYGVFYCGIARAKQLVKDIFPSETWGNITPVEHNLNEDLLYWIFKKYIDIPDEPLSQSAQIYVTSLESYMGKTRDNVNAMRGEGSRISTILGTLAFLFNNENLKAVRPQVQYGNESILVEIGLTGTFKFWENSYRGNLFRQLRNEEKENAIVIYIFLEILPVLVQCYQENLIGMEWSPQLKVDFLKRLGVMIRERVNRELLRIESENQQNQGMELEELEDDLDEENDLDIDDDDDDQESIE